MCIPNTNLFSAVYWAKPLILQFCQQVGQLLRTGAYVGFILQPRSIKRDIGLRIERFALNKLFTYGLQDSYLILVSQKGALALAFHEAEQQHFFRWLQVDRLARALDNLHIVEETRCSSAQRDNHILECRDFAQKISFNIPESRFTRICEYLSDGLMETMLNKVIKIHKLQSHHFGQSPAQSGFASTHITYQINPLHPNGILQAQRYKNLSEMTNILTVIWQKRIFYVTLPHIYKKLHNAVRQVLRRLERLCSRNI